MKESLALRNIAMRMDEFRICSMYSKLLASKKNGFVCPL